MNGKVEGVGFIVAPHLAKKITHCEIFSEPIAMLVLELDGGSTMKLLSVYAPTGAYGDDAVEEFYDALENATNGPPKGTYVVRAYNAHLGRGESGENLSGHTAFQDATVEEKHWFSSVKELDCR
nr:endonuclease-reverse transcriptase [Haemonchus contortus]